RRVPPLGIVRVQRGDGPVGVACGHEETPAARVAGDAMGDAGGGEDEGPLLDGAPPGGGAERVLLLAHRIPPRTSGILRRIPRTHHTTLCEWKGVARHYTIAVAGRTAENAAWFYPAPAPGYETIADHVAFYPARVDACYVDGERVRAQEGDFYGGWITRDVSGPFKGGPGTQGW